ncbi:stage V sporulation protein K [Lachnospiraceae bacterium KHCPX20]|nr:stage V sporulation protein K [Lachnospiraceae bacterium KHCPX20]
MAHIKVLFFVVLIIGSIVSYKPLERWRKELRDEAEYDENGISKKHGNFKDLSGEERRLIEQQKMIDRERLLSTPVLKKITHKGTEDPVKEMEQLIGLTKVKEQMRQMAARMQYEMEEYEKRNKKKLKRNQTLPHSAMHMCFYGPPGTGKTTCARIMTGYLYKYRYIRKNTCVEVDGNFFRDVSAGETSKKTKMLIQAAMGGVLFIDEAYAILEERSGQEVIATIVKEMEDKRDDIILIFAGYDREMKQLINSNPGLESRIKYNLWFGNYTINDLSEIFRLMANKEGYTVSYDMDVVFRDRIEKEMHKSNFGNARTVRTIFEKCIDQHATNVIDQNIAPNDRYILKGVDMPAFR